MDKWMWYIYSNEYYIVIKKNEQEWESIFCNKLSQPEMIMLTEISPNTDVSWHIYQDHLMRKKQYLQQSIMERLMKLKDWGWMLISYHI